MPKAQVNQGAQPVKWRTVKLKDGRKVRIAIVKKAGPVHGKRKGDFGGPADGVHTKKGK
jgi:hypothetical protein